MTPRHMSTNQRINWSAAAVLVGLLTNMMVGAWYASSLTSRVAALESKVAPMSADHELLVRIDERLRLMTDDMKAQMQDLKEGRK
jgi:hypothetical protein